MAPLVADEDARRRPSAAMRPTQAFFDAAPSLQPDRSLITGVVCGVRVEDLEPSTMKEIRYLDKLVDELSRGTSMDKILRTPASAG